MRSCYLLWQKKLEESQRIQQPKHCEYNNQDKDNSLRYVNKVINWSALEHLSFSSCEIEKITLISILKLIKWKIYFDLLNLMKLVDLIKSKIINLWI